ncbi:MAG: response regulator [Desulfovibrio sp.]|jgi:signal transduction histidine kinase/CheY-like chemotaxis protein/PAS domain-containing protein|nr:response regulator [Desulfovibrio sp.]
MEQSKEQNPRQDGELFCEPAPWEWDGDSGLVISRAHWEYLMALPEGGAAAETHIRFLCERMHKDDLPLFRQALQDALAGRQPHLDIPVRLQRQDGSWAWILFRGQCRPSGQKGLRGTALDVSRLRLDTRFLPPHNRDGQSSYQRLLDNSPFCIMRCDRELFPLYINPAVERQIACKADDLGAKRIEELSLRAEDLEFFQTCVSAVFDTGEVRRTRRLFRSYSTQQPLVGDFCFWPEFDNDGATVKSVLIQFQDLTNQIRQEQLLRLEEMRFSALYQLTQMHDSSEEEILLFVVRHISLLTGSEHSHLFVPPYGPHRCGYTLWFSDDRSSKNPGTQRIWRQFHVDGMFPLSGLKPTIRNDAKAFPPQHFFGDSQYVTRYMYTPALEGSDITCVAAVYNKDSDYDDEDLRRLELFISGAWLILRRQSHVDALKKAKESAVRANEVKDRFLANVSHELRTPLNGLLGMLQILDNSPLSDEQREYVRNADLAGKTLLRIISDILDFSRMQAGALVLDAAPFALSQTLLSTLQLFRSEAEKKGISLEYTQEGDFPARVQGDEARIRQIIFNLMGNALKFTARGSIRLHCAVLPCAKKGKIWLYLALRDTGIGIPKDMQEAVFDAFTQVRGPDAGSRQGTGLGLSIVRSLARQMDGTVSLESAPGKGTTVHCTLGLDPAPDEEPAPDRERTRREKGKNPPMVILVAEDDEVSRLTMTLFLRREGHRVFCVENGRQALEALLLYPFDCLISDVMMPEMDGVELTRRIRLGIWKDIAPSPAMRADLPGDLPGCAGFSGTIPLDLPIVSVSALAMSGDRERFLQQGMDFYLSKPVNAAELSEVLDQAQARRPLRP